METQEIGELFLINFIQQLASVANQSPENTEENKIELQEIAMKPEMIENSKAVEMIPEFLTPVKTISTKKQNLEIGSKRQKSIISQIPIRERFVQQPQQRSQFSNTARKPQTLLQVDINQLPTAEKLNFLIKDPAVTEIECVGAEQQLLVKKGGSIQRTHVKLSIEEIYQLIAEFSQKTKIPVLDGTIKAALNNLIITAVLSEMLGPRFILQKKNPFQQLV